MVRLSNTAGAVVDVSDATATALGSAWAPVEGARAGYDDLTVDALKDEIRRRNDDGRDETDRLLLTGSKADLVKSLDADDR